MLNWMATITCDQIILSAICCCAVGEMMIHLLPDAVAGPGGWLVDTGDN
ncbi:hypothetical protein [Actibacterium sp. D379-3]